jgi:hypothetical protein
MALEPSTGTSQHDYQHNQHQCANHPSHYDFIETYCYLRANKGANYGGDSEDKAAL